MSLESDLEEIELYLGHNPVQGIGHPNPQKTYKKSFIKELFNKFKKKPKKEEVWH